MALIGAALLAASDGAGSGSLARPTGRASRDGAVLAAPSPR
jgi:hypothetical protein